MLIHMLSQDMVGATKDDQQRVTVVSLQRHKAFVRLSKERLTLYSFRLTPEMLFQRSNQSAEYRLLYVRKLNFS